MTEEIKNKIKQLLKRNVKRLIKVAILPIMVFLIIFAASTYFITIDDGTYKEDDWSSVPYGAGSYINGTMVDSDGKISSSMSAEELWKKMIQNGSRVKDYLKSPKELARLMRAEIVTQYPDTRPNPDEEINWEELIEDSDTLQGIIKFKRAQSDGNKTTMSYVDPQTFQSYIDDYNNTGNETAKNNALTHFTLKKTGASTTNDINYDGPDLCWPVEPQFTEITSYFGYRGDIGVAGASKDHGAIDIGNSGIDKTNLYACEAGTVVGTSNDGSNQRWKTEIMLK